MSVDLAADPAKEKYLNGLPRSRLHSCRLVPKNRYMRQENRAIEKSNPYVKYFVCFLGKWNSLICFRVTIRYTLYYTSCTSHLVVLWVCVQKPIRIVVLNRRSNRFIAPTFANCLRYVCVRTHGLGVCTHIRTYKCSYRLEKWKEAKC